MSLPKTGSEDLSSPTQKSIIIKNNKSFTFYWDDELFIALKLL
jgi:hypothetical protein